MTDDMTMAMDDDMSMTMNMSFEFTCDVGPLVFGWWTISSCTSFYLSCIPVILLSVARHWTFSLVSGGKKAPKGATGSKTTALLDANALDSSPPSRSLTNPCSSVAIGANEVALILVIAFFLVRVSFCSDWTSEPIGRLHRLVWTLVSTTGAALSLVSMLVVMTYNSGLFIAVLIGEAIGFWIWGNHNLPEAMRGCH